MSRITIEQYAMKLAMVAAERSEDPYRQVGAVALNDQNRIIATGYNGLPPGFIVKNNFWEDRGFRRHYMIHAEVNLCSLFRRGECKLIAVTTMPCPSCMIMLVAYGVSRVLYHEEYDTDAEGIGAAIAGYYGLTLDRV